MKKVSITYSTHFSPFERSSRTTIRTCQCRVLIGEVSLRLPGLGYKVLWSFFFFITYIDVVFLCRKRDKLYIKFDGLITSEQLHWIRNVNSTECQWKVMLREKGSPTGHFTSRKGTQLAHELSQRQRNLWITEPDCKLWLQRGRVHLEMPQDLYLVLQAPEPQKTVHQVLSGLLL